MLTIDELNNIIPTPITIDVRSGKEFRKGHITGAQNLPLLNENERGEVGTLYKKVGKEKAIERGLEIISPKLPFIYKIAKDKGGKVCIYCWRGGLRSRFVNSNLKLADIKSQQLKGGYKQYRQWVLKQFELYQPQDLLVIDGLTGCGKTKLLNELKLIGFSVIDLEALASHRGSVFGDIATPAQPTQQQFENDLALELHKIGIKRPIILEGESQRIGYLQIPKAFFDTMDKAPRLILEDSLENRAERILDEYIRPFPKTVVEDRVLKIEKRLGRERCKELVDELRSGNEKRFVTRILDEYYDKKYLRSYQRRKISGQPIYYSTNEKNKILHWLNSYSDNFD